MMTQHCSSKQNFRSKTLVALTWFVLGLFFVISGPLNSNPAMAQSAAIPPPAVATATAAQGIVGDWQGTLHTPQKDLRIVVKITEANPGGLKVVDYSIDQGGQPLPATSASFEDGVFKYAIEFIEGS